MPIFGLVWVASWVNCFFSSSQELLRTPSYLNNALPMQATLRASGSQRDMHSLIADRAAIARSLSPQKQSLSQSIQSFQPSPVISLLLPLDANVTLPSFGLISAFKGLLSGFQKLTAVPSSPLVVVTQAESMRVGQPNLKQAKPLGFRQCLPIAQTDRSALADGSGHAPQTKRFFQVKVKHYVVSTVSKRQEAMQIAQRLEQVLKAAKPQLNQLQPGIVNGLPAGKLGDRVLFTVDKQVAGQWDCTPDVLAIQWINDLRLAVAQAPLSIADAQTKMYGLQATGQHIEGLASWYGPYFHGRVTATGETFNQDDLTAAHPSLPFDTYLKVKNVANGRSVIVRVNDRGPYFEDRTLDLSREAARCLGSETAGVVTVEAEIMAPVKASVPANQAIAHRL